MSSDELVLGQVYRIMVAGDPKASRAMLVQMPVMVRQSCWAIYGRNGGLRLADHTLVVVLGLHTDGGEK